MNPTPKTIQIFLPGGDPRGIRIAEITTRILQVMEVPRRLGNLSCLQQVVQATPVKQYGPSREADAEFGSHGMQHVSSS